MRLSVVIQPHFGENAIAAIATMLSYYGCYVPVSEMRRYNVTSRGGSSPEQVRDMAARYGLETEILEMDMDGLARMDFPVVVRWKKASYCIIKKIRGGKVFIADPAKGEYPMTVSGFAEKFRGTVLSMKPGKDFKKGGRRQNLVTLIGHRLGDAKKPLFWLGILNMLAVGLNLLMVRSTRIMLDKKMTLGGGDWFDDIFAFRIDADSLYRALVVGMVLILIASTIVSVCKSLLIFDTAYSVAAESGSGLFHKILSQPMGFFEQYRSGELIQRMEDNSQLDLSLVRTIVPRLLDFLMTIIYLGLMVRYNWKVAVSCVLVEALYLAFSMMMKERIAMQARGRIYSTGNMNTSLLNGLATIETIKTGGFEGLFFSRWKQTQLEYNKNSLTGSGITIAINISDNLHNLLSQAVLLFVGAYFMIQGEFTFGLMAALQAVLQNFRSAFSNCINMINSLQETRTDIERIEDILEREDVTEYTLTEDKEPDKLPGKLEVRGLSYRYQEGEPLAISDISFTAEPGQLVAVVGASGCGKSTLLKCLLSLYEPESGEIKYGGCLRSEIPDVVFHATVTAVDQECVVFEDSIANNISMWDSTVEDYEMILAARDAHIHDRIKREREGYYSQMIENGRNFSGGELQRLELARALSAEPTILLLDEFTSALDAITEAGVFDSIRKKGTTCIIVAHRLSTVASCDTILVMDGGKIVQRGSHEELISTDGMYRNLIKVPEEK